MTVNEYGTGCPVAYYFSNRADETIFKLFFSQMKSKVGVIEPEVFMCNDAPAYYNAWSIVMGDVPHRLLCIWHVDRNWRKHLCKIKRRAEKKFLVYKTLRVLLQITSVDEFKTCQDQVINDLLKDEDTHAFGIYFKDSYSKRSEVWAYCYRLKKGINTNMYLESFHKVLKHYLEGKKCQRLDKIINSVMKINRDIILKRLIKISKNVMTSKEKKICESHTRGESITTSSI
ncbi:uncharacterized protein LOC112687015 [Sipha flava]|jgi:hypothetical protein|uniref:Uncharacterized protein LOC112687015 n=1 Tax=Sipha flava TaxID=143950 RepID=A0A8B8FXQ7_9HEMI|nr:uncharacterized protein LOC112687015 [Sipha flava]